MLSSFSRYIPLAIGLIILCIIAMLAPWEQIDDLLEKIPPLVFLSLFGLSILYYVAKAVRFWYILRLLSISADFKTVSLLYFSGQPFSILPAGELYRTVLLKKHLGISISKSSPSVTIQGLVEAIVLLALSLFGALIIGQSALMVAVIGVLLAIVIIALQRGWLNRSYTLIDKLPYVSISQRKFQIFVQSHRDVLVPKSLLFLVLLSLVPVLSGIGILYIASDAVGFDMGFIESMIGYSLPVILSGLSFLPGGLGVSEGGTIGILQLFGATAAGAIAITLLLRIFTLVAGLLFGVVAQVILHTQRKIV